MNALARLISAVRPSPVPRRGTMARVFYAWVRAARRTELAGGGSHVLTQIGRYPDLIDEFRARSLPHIQPPSERVAIRRLLARAELASEPQERR